MATRTVTFTLEVSFDDEHTDADSVSDALDTLMDTATSTPGILDEHGSVSIGAFYPPKETSE